MFHKKHHSSKKFSKNQRNVLINTQLKLVGFFLILFVTDNRKLGSVSNMCHNHWINSFFGLCFFTFVYKCVFMHFLFIQIISYCKFNFALH